MMPEPNTAFIFEGLKLQKNAQVSNVCVQFFSLFHMIHTNTQICVCEVIFYQFNST